MPITIDWDNVPHYTLRFTPNGEAELTDKDGAPHDAFNAAISRGLKLEPGEKPVLTLLTRETL